MIYTQWVRMNRIGRILVRSLAMEEQLKRDDRK